MTFSVGSKTVPAKFDALLYFQLTVCHMPNALLHGNGHQTRRKVSLQCCTALRQIQGQLWKKSSGWKCGLQRHRWDRVAFISRFSRTVENGIVWICVMALKSPSLLLICSNPRLQFSSTTQLSLHFYRILDKEKRGKASHRHFSHCALVGGPGISTEVSAHVTTACSQAASDNSCFLLSSL